MEFYQLGAVEARFAQIVWDNEPISTRTLVELCAEQLHWKRTTTYTVLRKLSEKGFFKTENSMVTSVISYAEYQSIRSEAFVEEAFGGSLPALVSAFGARTKLSDRELAQLQAIIDDMRR